MVNVLGTQVWKDFFSQGGSQFTTHKLGLFEFDQYLVPITMVEDSMHGPC